MNVVFVSPNPADAELAVGFLRAHRLETILRKSIDELGPLVSTDIGCVVVVEEALTEPGIHAFHEALRDQPAWSDLPLVLVAGQSSSLSALIEQVFPSSGNVTLLQRPLHPVTLVSAVGVAMRSRERQLQVRDLLEQREDALRRRDEFLAMLAHELRNPLAPIRNAAYLLGTLDYEDALFLKCRTMIDKQTRHVARLVDDLLDVSRLELGKVDLRAERVDVNDIIAAAVEACASITALHRHSVQLRPWPTPVIVNADPVRIEQVVVNLIVNATKFTPDGGRLEVACRTDKGSAVISVVDNGVGIDPDKLEEVFELFMQARATRARTEGGLGIGLTLVRHLMQLHDGEVKAFSEGHGRGSRFEARLPLSPDARARDAARPSTDEGEPPRRVLIVEDGHDARDTLGMLIESWHHEVIYARSGPEGVARARHDKPDVAVVDIGLPGCDGYEVAREIRGDGSDWSRNVCLIALTGYGQPADRQRAMDAGFDVHVLKPIDPFYLRELLGEVRVPG
jgi:signal transduction histidine kinase